jgi:polyribonucleotide nucleotidyltransferase
LPALHLFNQFTLLYISPLNIPYPSAAADIPLTKAVAGVRVGYLPSAGFIINPSAAQMAQSQLDLMMAGTAEAVLMIEGFCDWLTEDQMLEVSYRAVRVLQSC